MRRISSLGLLLAALSLGVPAPSVRAAEPSRPATQAPASLELNDQYDAPQKLAFPAAKVTLLTIADKKGSDQISGWIEALKPKYADRIDIRGLADCGGAPGFIHGTIRKKFRETRKYPVMLDWTGKACAQFGYDKNVANLLVIRKDGSIAGRFSGPATAGSIAAASTALDQAIASAAAPSTPKP
jgi:hypothetical protein